MGWQERQRGRAKIKNYELLEGPAGSIFEYFSSSVRVVEEEKGSLPGCALPLFTGSSCGNSGTNQAGSPVLGVCLLRGIDRTRTELRACGFAHLKGWFLLYDSGCSFGNSS